MNEQIDRWTNRQMNEQIDGQTGDGQTNRIGRTGEIDNLAFLMSILFHRQTEVWLNEKINTRTDRRTDRQTDRQIDKQIRQDSQDR
jgi:hypothetical protein